MENRVSYAFVLLAFVAFAQSNASEEPTTVPKSNPTTPAAPTAVPSTTVTVPQTTTNKVAETDNTLANNASAKGIMIDVYYEAMCSDSVDFFSKQLQPVHEALNKFINVTFIPFALGKIEKVKDSNVPNITCGRGESECTADKVHACGIDKIKDADKLMKFVTCALVDGYKSSNKSVPIAKCGENSTIASDVVSSITACSNGSDWIPLFEKYHDASVMVPVKNVPTIVFNKVYSKDVQESSLKDFKKTVCKMIPSADQPDYCKDIAGGSGTLVVGLLPILLGVYYVIGMF